ncbi:hypothetical protein YC2023_084177 [Brassica napus]
MAPILGHMSLELGFGEDVVALWRVFLAGEGVNTCLVHATRVNELGFVILSLLTSNFRHASHMRVHTQHPYIDLD